MNKLFINILLVIFCFLFFGCTEDIPDKIDKSAVPAPPSLQIISATVKNQDEISPDQPIIFSFNNPMDVVNIAITEVNGSVVFDSARTSITFKPSTTLTDGSYTLIMSGKDEFGQEITPSAITFYVKSGLVYTNSSMIAYTSNSDGDYEICLIKTDGTGFKQLTYNFAQDTQPSWSPDGQYIAFSSDRDGDSAWNSDIFIIRSDGTGLTNLTKTKGVNEYGSFWSLNGRLIGFMSDVDGFAEYYVMNTDGTGQRLMDDWEYLDFKWPGVYGDYYVYSDYINGNNEILVDFFSNPQGGINLTNNFANDIYPSWSPDGHRIVFASDRDFNSEIYIMNADGTNQTRITYNSADDDHPAWSPF